MEKHFNIKELVDFAYLDSIDEASVKYIAEVNRHLYSCKKCEKLYNSILQLKEEIERENMTDSKFFIEKSLSEYEEFNSSHNLNLKQL